MVVDIREVQRRRGMQAYCRPLRWREIMTERPPAELPFHDLFREVYPSPRPMAAARRLDEDLVASLDELVDLYIATGRAQVIHRAAVEHEVEEIQIIEEYALVDRRRAEREPLVDWHAASPIELWTQIGAGSYLESLMSRPRGLMRRAVDWVIAQVLAPAVNPASLV
jgi:hypothetical protein